MISVIIPAYNRAKLIGRAVQSVLAQTLPVQEIIVVDDASDDGTAQAALQVFPQVRILSLPQRSGAQAARAAGVKAATGQWIAFLDSDDVWLPKKLELQMAVAKQGFPVVHGPALLRKKDKEKLFPIPPLSGSVYAELLRYPAPLYPSLLVRRSCFETAGFPDPAIISFQEWDMSLMLARHFTFGYVDEPLFIYEVQKESISTDKYREIRGYEQIVCKWWREIQQVAGPEAGLDHYFFLAKLAKRFLGATGYVHYIHLGAKLSGKAFWPLFFRLILKRP